MAVLPTNYLDDILAASMGGKRRFRITHEDGSTEEVTLEDVSEYDQVGSNFGAAQVNQTNEAVNEKLESADVVDPALATVLGFAADAKLTGDALSELNKKFGIVKTYLTVEGIPALGSNYNVQIPIDNIPNDAEIYSVTVTATSGCIVGTNQLPSMSNNYYLGCSVYNPTDKVRTPIISVNLVYKIVY